MTFVEAILSKSVSNAYNRMLRFGRASYRHAQETDFTSRHEMYLMGMIIAS